MHSCLLVKLDTSLEGTLILIVKVKLLQRQSSCCVPDLGQLQINICLEPVISPIVKLMFLLWELPFYDFRRRVFDLSERWIVLHVYFLEVTIDLILVHDCFIPGNCLERSLYRLRR